MTHTPILRRLAVVVLATLALAGGWTAAARAVPVRYAPLPDTSQLKRTADPGYARAEAQCGTCHSRDYVTTQPPGKGKAFWTAEVTKMVNVYGAPIPEPDRAAIADYLASAY